MPVQLSFRAHLAWDSACWVINGKLAPRDPQLTTPAPSACCLHASHGSYPPPPPRVTFRPYDNSVRRPADTTLPASRMRDAATTRVFPSKCAFSGKHGISHESYCTHIGNIVYSNYYKI